MISLFETLFFYIKKSLAGSIFNYFLLTMYLSLITDICLGYLIRVREGRMLGKRDFRHNISMCVCGGGGGWKDQRQDKDCAGSL